MKTQEPDHNYISYSSFLWSTYLGGDIVLNLETFCLFQKPEELEEYF